MKKFMTLILALAMALTMVACGSKKEDEQVFTVGVVQLVQHEALDAATQGFTDALKEALGDKVNVVVKNASNDPQTCTTIVNGFLADKVDLIMANATPPLPTPCLFWAPLSPITPPLWRSTTGAAP